jgi:hypothetical protein
VNVTANLSENIKACGILSSGAEAHNSGHSARYRRGVLVNEIPDWIGKEVEEANRKLEVNKTRARKSLEHSSTTRKKGPKFWQELLYNLRNNTDNLPSIGLTGNTSLVSSPQKAEQTCRVSVNKSGAFPIVTHTDIFYTPGENSIRSRALGNHEGEFVFRVLANGEIGAIQYGLDTMPKDASAMAASIVERMALIVRDHSR